MQELLERAEGHLRASCFEEAIGTYESLLADGVEGLGLLLRQLVPLYLKTRRPLRALDAANALCFFERSAEAYSMQSMILARLGLDPIPSTYRALELDPQNRGIINELLFNLATALPPADYLREAKRWAFPSLPRVASSDVRSSAPRIGYVTGDAKQHVMDRILEPLLRYSSLETIIYDNTEKQDATSTRLRQWGTKWKYIFGLRAEAVAEQVRRDGIDVLVDLSGLTAGNRLDVFSRRPAPIQVTGLGCLFTTGLDCFNYRLADVEDQRHYSELLWRLSTSIAPLHLCPQLHVTPLPARRNGFITFGFVNGLRKLTPETLKLAISCLSAVPNSKLLVMCLGASDPETATSILRRFGSYQDRVLLTESVGGLPFARLFSEIDIALDPTPYGGCMTSFDTLFHGVPIICSPGERRVNADAARLQLQMLFGQFVAKDGDYAKIAFDVTQDLDSLENVRRELRPALLRHSAGDPCAWVMGLERAYKSMTALPRKRAA